MTDFRIHENGDTNYISFTYKKRTYTMDLDKKILYRRNVNGYKGLDKNITGNISKYLLNHFYIKCYEFYDKYIEEHTLYGSNKFHVETTCYGSNTYTVYYDSNTQCSNFANNAMA